MKCAIIYNRVNGNTPDYISDMFPRNADIDKLGLDISMSSFFVINVKMKEEDPLRFQVLKSGTTYQQNYTKKPSFSFLRNI